MVVHGAPCRIVVSRTRWIAIELHIPLVETSLAYFSMSASVAVFLKTTMYSATAVSTRSRSVGVFACKGTYFRTLLFWVLKF